MIIENSAFHFSGSNFFCYYLKQSWFQETGLQEAVVIHPFLWFNSKMIWMYEQLKRVWGRGVPDTGIACVPISARARQPDDRRSLVPGAWAGSSLQNQVYSHSQGNSALLLSEPSIPVARQLRSVICRCFEGTAYSLSTSFNYLLLLICVGLKNMRKVSGSCHVVNQRPECGFSIFNKSTRTFVGIPALAELVVGAGMVN